MAGIRENHDQFKAMAQNTGGGPFVMLNLLRFKPGGGVKKYRAYAARADPFLTAVGGKVVFSGRPVELLNGDETWDAMLLVRYPSREAFLRMANDPEYIKVHELRAEAVERAVLYSTDEMGLAELLVDR